MHLPMGSESQSEAGSDESPLGSRRQSRMVSYRVRLGRVWWSYYRVSVQQKAVGSAIHSGFRIADLPMVCLQQA